MYVVCVSPTPVSLYRAFGFATRNTSGDGFCCTIPAVYLATTCAGVLVCLVCAPAAKSGESTLLRLATGCVKLPRC